VEPSKNYYGILDVASDANQEEIKAAYRKKVKRYHPDHYGQDRDRDPFLDVQEAYEVLSDPAQRADYDDARERPRARSVWSRGYPDATPHGPGTPEPLRPRHSPVDSQRPDLNTQRASYPPSDPFAIFDAFFDEVWGPGRPQPSSSQRASSDLHVAISLTPDQARRGGDVHLLIPVTTPCPVCQRQGGRRMQSVQRGYRCQACHGAGTITQEHPVSVPFPAGIQNNTTLFASLDPLGLDGARLALHFTVTQ
jgi:DnaJ-class molecular chaperone